MKRLTRKLKSETGASLLLVLLFFLICVMVMASVLMAAASNAGKVRSNREEHQRYLALASALQLVCDDLTGAKYRGQYTFSIEKDYAADPSDPNQQILVATRKIFAQTTGAVENSQIGALLIDDFDYIFGKRMTEDMVLLKKIDAEVQDPETRDLFSPAKHTITVTPAVDGMEDQAVTITLEVVEESYSIELEAELDGFRMLAEVTADDNQPNISTIPGSEGQQTTTPMRWKLGWITKEGTGQ
jgi:hypothetical protein